MNKDIEDFLLEHIGLGQNTAGKLYKEFPGGLILNHDKFRTIDNGLRRLVKAGKIKFNRNIGWSLVPVPVDPVKDNSLVNAVG